MDSVKSMTSGSPGRLIFSFALPLMVGNLFQQLYTVADAMIVGQVLGVGAIAAVGAAEWMIWLMQGMIQGFTQGFSIWMAQAFGAGKTDELRRVVANSAVLSAAIAVVMVYNLLAAILRSLGDGKTPLYAMIFASVLNIALDLLFVIVFHWGVAGAAAATVTAQLASAIFCLARLRSIEMLRLAKTDFVLTPATHGKLLQLGFPMAFQNAVISVGGMIVQSVVNSFGVHFIAGFTATNKLYGMLEVAATSYGFAMTTYTGQNIGAGKQERVRSGYRAAMGIAMLTSLVIMVAMILGGRAILRCFISGDAQTVEDTLAIAYHYLFIMSVCLPILYYLHVTRSCIQGMGNTVLPMVSGIAEFLMRTGAALLLPLLMGQEGIFYAEISAWAGADVVLFFSYRYCMKKQKG